MRKRHAEMGFGNFDLDIFFLLEKYEYKVTQN